MVLDDGFSRGVVDSELLSDLRNNGWSYVDDAHSFLNVAQQSLPHLLPYLFVTLSGEPMLHEYRLDSVAN